MKREISLDPGDIDYCFPKTEYPEVVDACEEILQRIPDEEQERFTEHFEAWYAEVAIKATPAIWTLISTAVLTIGLVVLSEVAGVRAMIDRTWGGDNQQSAPVLPPYN